MARALKLAQRAIGFVEPNPLVGAVVVKSGRVVGEGFHQQFGGPHAEVHALRAAGAKAKDATLYVTLEPCSHWGKTPPCTDAILAAGVSRVVVAMVDPFPAVHGKGIAILRKHGLQVETGILEHAAQDLNRPFLTRILAKRPFVIAKWAQSMDGCVALGTGESKWISSEESRAWVQSLRGRMDAILVGINTALADDPLLMARPERASDIRRLATRIVIDSTCKLLPASQLVRTIPFAPVLLIHAKSLNAAAEKRRRLLESKGVMTVPISADKAGRPQLRPLLKYLAERDYTNILVEGGPTLMAEFIRRDLVDEAHLFIAPIVVGGDTARHAIAGSDLRRLADASKFEFTAASRSGPDLHLVAKRPAPSPRAS